MMVTPVARSDRTMSHISRRSSMATDPGDLVLDQSWLGLFEQFFRFDKWNACRVQAAAICDSRLK
jgi:hypothetical protein